MYPFYLGLDLHLKRTYVVLMNTEGEVIDERRLPNKEVADYLEEHVPPYPHSPKAKASPWLALNPALPTTVRLISTVEQETSLEEVLFTRKNRTEQIT
jgi:hypothetical protein